MLKDSPDDGVYLLALTVGIALAACNVVVPLKVWVLLGEYVIKTGLFVRELLAELGYGVFVHA